MPPKIKQPKTIENKYQKKTQREHVLARPDTYVGSTTLHNELLWIFDETTNKMVKKEISYPPGLYKIFDEILVNARDQIIDDSKCDTIKVDIIPEENKIIIFNNGVGIPVVEHPEHKMLIPELIFGELLTSTNFDDDDRRITGGRNGLGAKLTNIFSKVFEVETACCYVDEVTKKVTKKHFYQKFSDNLLNRTKPVIKTLTSDNPKTFTQISFVPDLEKFGLTNLTSDIISLFKKRVYDICACTPQNTKVYLNGNKLDTNTFKKYIDLYYLTTENEFAYEESDNGRWKIGIIYSPDCGYEQVSFVNSICTYLGGSHVNYIVDELIKKLIAAIKKKDKDIIIRPQQIKENLIVFIDAIIDNPCFTSQTKEELRMKNTDFGSTCELSDKFINKILKCGIIDKVISLAKFKESSAMKKTDGRKATIIRGIPKLEDANEAGTKNSYKCKLILTEGDSAKALVMGARKIIGSDYYGIFPLRGKVLNVREASMKQLLENQEIIHLKQILGLQQGKEYNDIKQLRYGGIIILSDQDADGSHIKGLLLNLFHYCWPSLLKSDNFVFSLSTPIVKATKGKDTMTFYNLTDYNNWKLKTKNNKSWTIKYYKGLGTSKDTDGQEYFTDIDDKLIKYIWDTKKEIESSEIFDEKDNILEVEENEEVKENRENEELEETIKSEASASNNNSSRKLKSKKKNMIGKELEHNPNDTCTDSMTLAFAGDRANDRKKWLLNYNGNYVLSNDQKSVNVTDFVNKELIHFSFYDIQRSIPSICDGFKPSQRKALYGSFLKKIYNEKTEIKVAQLSGFIAEKTCYHHGETSMQGTIINIAQDFVGSNNINVLFPNGQFGTRMQGGKDSASPRYIFTYLNKLTPMIFNEKDDPILTLLDDDGIIIEPKNYIPLIPMILVNGTTGIGTGFSTNVPCFNPLDIIKNIYNYLDGTPMNEMIPWYKGFHGTITKINDHSYETRGKYEIQNNNTLIITELPIGMWTEQYKEFLESIEVSAENKTSYLDGFSDQNTSQRVYFILHFTGNKLQLFLKNGTLEKDLKLIQNVSTNNMHLFDNDGRIKKYNTPEDIIKEFCKIRLDGYTARKQYYIKKLDFDIVLYDWKIQFIEDVIDKKIEIFRKPKKDVIQQLQQLKYPQLSTEIGGLVSYDYLTSLSWTIFTTEKIDEFNEKLSELEKELEILKNTTEIDMWKKELGDFTKEYKIWYSNFEEANNTELSFNNSDAKSISKKPKPQKTAATKKRKQTKKVIKTKNIKSNKIDEVKEVSSDESDESDESDVEEI